jgi:U4/U6 small nuclear ribonucleoprotein PRP4
VVATGMPYPPLQQGNEGPTATGEEEEEVTKYTHASNELVAARQAIAEFSLQRAQIRLQKERAFRSVCRNLKKRQRNEDIQSEDAATEQELESINIKCIQTYKSLRQMTLEGSQYGDSRALSCICTTQNNVLLDGSKIIATGSWTGNVQLWDGSGGKNTSLTKIGERLCCHEDRIMGMAMMTTTSTTATSAFLCTTSIDRTAKLWKVQRNGESLMLNEKVDPNHDSWSIVEQAHFKGHTKRLCRTAFHPMKKHLATTSFDYSWRLWDIETSQDTMQLLLQDGHWKETYGIGFHPDGSLCATTDFAGVIQLWDLRTGKSIRHFLGHAKRILNAEFHPTNGYQLVSSGDDGTIKIWDIRQRKQLSSIPAHSNLISQLRFDPDPCGEYLVSSSFDGTIKLWSTRTWKLLNTMKGHDGKVSGVDIISSMKGNHCARSIVSCGFDKTLKIWR